MIILIIIIIETIILSIILVIIARILHLVDVDEVVIILQIVKIIPQRVKQTIFTMVQLVLIATNDKMVLIMAMLQLVCTKQVVE